MGRATTTTAWIQQGRQLCSILVNELQPRLVTGVNGPNILTSEAICSQILEICISLENLWHWYDVYLSTQPVRRPGPDSLFHIESPNGCHVNKVIRFYTKWGHNGTSLYALKKQHIPLKLFWLKIEDIHIFFFFS